MEGTKRQKIAILILFFVFIAVLLPGLNGHIYDTFCFRMWSINMNQHGLKMAYHSDTDYPPVYQYVLWLFEKIAHTEKAVYEKIAYLRLVTMLFELVSIWVVYHWTNKKMDMLLLFMVCVLNPGFFYNTLLWGQVDGILSCMVFMAIWLMWQGKLLPALLVMLIAVNMKFQSIIFLPVLGLLLLQADFKTKWKQLLLAIPCLLLLEGVLIYPFILTETSRQNLHDAFFGAVGRFPYLSIYAFNLWYWFFPKPDALKIDDTLPLLGSLSYRYTGMLLFFGSSFFILLPLLKATLLKAFMAESAKHTAFPRAQLWLISAAIPLVFFYFNTQMHERYSHPAFIFLIAYAVYTKDIIPFVLMSIACFMNLEMEMRWLKLENYNTLIFDPRFISGIYILLIGYVLFRIYKPYKKKGETEPLLYINNLSNTASV